MDGVLYADPEAFAALLRFSGPVEVPGTDIVLTPDNAVQFLTVDQFEELPSLGGGDPLAEVIRDAVGKFTSQQLPGPRALADTFGPLVDAGHLRFVSLHDDDVELLERLGLDGALAPPPGGDLLSVTTRNANPSKIDAYLYRDVAYDVDWNPVTGQVRSRATVTLRNEVPEEGLPPVVTQSPEGTRRGTNRTQVSVFSPLDVTGATIDGEVSGVGTLQEVPGVQRHALWVEIPPGEERTVVVELTGAIGADTAYRLRWVGLPAVHPGEARVTVRAEASDTHDRRTVRRRFPGAGTGHLRITP